LLIQVSVPLAAEPLRGEFQLFPEPIETTVQDYSDHSANELIDDARWIFSGMIYGYIVTWVPPFSSRGVKEKFTIELVAQIPTGDEKLKTLSADEIDGITYVLMEYSSDSAQQKRLEAWRSTQFPFTAGEGNSPTMGGSRREALEMAIKEAVKNYLMRRNFNRPKSVQARVALIDFPQIGLSNGIYRALVRIRMNPHSVQDYKID